MSRVLGTLLLLLCWLAPAFAADRYVSTAGNNNNDGSQGSPWRTVQKAAESVNAGDTVFIHGGTYSERVTFPRSGSAGNLITFVNFPNEVPVIDGAGVGVSDLVVLTNVHHVVVRGLTLRNASNSIVTVGGDTHHLQLDHLDISGSGGANVFISQSGSTPSFNRLTNSKVHDAYTGGIAVWNAPAGYWLIEGNEVYGNKGNGNWDGIQIGGDTQVGNHHVVVRNNLIHDNGTCDCGADNLDLGGHNENHHYLAEKNIIYGNYGALKMHSGDTRFVYTVGVSGFHIMRFNQYTGSTTGYVTYDWPNPMVGYHNTFVDAHQMFFIYSDANLANRTLGDSTYAGGDTGRMNWKNNIFWQETASNFYLVLVGGPGSANLTYDSIRLQNNLYKFAPGNKISWGLDDEFYPPIDAAKFRAYQASKSPNNPDTGSILTTAAVGQAFVNYSARDYHLVAGSPAIDHGLPLTKATNSGANQTVLHVDRASYFFDGYCLNGECVGTPDTIRVGNNPPVSIVTVNDRANQITVATPLTWAMNDPVTLPYTGAAPDMGAYEFGETMSLPPVSPVLMRVTPQ